MLAVGHGQLDEPERRVHEGPARHVPAGPDDPQGGACSATNAAGPTSSRDFAFPALKATEPAERRREAEEWCDRFEANNAKWLKSTIAQWTGDDVELTYEDVDTSLIPPRPRLYGLVGAEDIEKVWKERAAARQAATPTATAARTPASWRSCSGALSSSPSPRSRKSKIYNLK